MKVNYLKLFFKNPLPDGVDLTLFRVACTNLNPSPLIHHHEPEADQLRYQYPLIQFKRTTDNRPYIIAFHEGIEEVLKIVANPKKNIQLHAHRYNLEVANMGITPYNVQIWDNSFNYALTDWLALNQKNYQAYFNTIHLTDKIELLEKILTAHILSFAQGIGIHINQSLSVKLIKIVSQTQKKYKGVSLHSFRLQFATNISLPNYIGLGKSSALGFGVVQGLKNKYPQKNLSEIHDTNTMRIDE
ncbi:MAG: CRISPR-associated endonuclease Cas6 [Phycisphaerales bacterium]|nr:CRISPR-associated endonuclease Cas6 [Phycisphaerales bacterium]